MGGFGFALIRSRFVFAASPMYEKRRELLIPYPLFLWRLARHLLISLGIIAGSLGLGILGFHFISGLPLIDALLNAAMLLGGMGPVGDLETWPAAGKVFASLYALYAGVVFLIAAGVIFAPVFHRFLHRFHLDLDETRKAQNTRAHKSAAKKRASVIPGRSPK